MANPSFHAMRIRDDVAHMVVRSKLLWEAVNNLEFTAENRVTTACGESRFESLSFVSWDSGMPQLVGFRPADDRSAVHNVAEIINVVVDTVAVFEKVHHGG